MANFDLERFRPNWGGGGGGGEGFLVQRRVLNRGVLKDEFQLHDSRHGTYLRTLVNSF